MSVSSSVCLVFFFFQAEDGIRDTSVTGVQTCALPISCEDHAVLLEVRGEPYRFLRGRRGDHGFGPIGERRDDGGRGAQRVDDDHAPAGEIPRDEAERREVDVDLHAGGGDWRSWGSRSRNFVSTRPAMKSGWRMTRLRKGMVVVTPSMINESSACRMRASASSRLLPCTISFASRES